MKTRYTTVRLLAGFLAAAAPARAVTLDQLLKAQPTRTATFASPGGQRLTMAVFEPAEVRAGERRPATVWIHGGGWTAGDAAAFFPQAAYAAERGAVGISVNYRLMGKGAATASDCLDDCRSAVAYVRAHADELRVDPARVAVLGDSSGGHLAACLGTIEDPVNGRASRPDAMVLYNPITDLTDGTWYYAVVGPPPKAKSTSRPSDEVLERARALSPLFHVAAGEPPTLLMHGLDDRVVPPEQSRRFDAALRAGGACTLELVPGARHAFAMTRYTAPPLTVVRTLISTDRFLTSLGYLAGEPTIELPAPTTGPSTAAAGPASPPPPR